MIFAFLDLAKYSFRRGRYSPGALRKEGAKRASLEEFPNFLNLPTGTVIFVHTYFSIRSWAIMYLTNAVWSHVTIVYEPGRLVDCTTDGVKFVPLNSYLDGKSFLSAFTFQYNSDESAVQAGLASRVGAGYGWMKILNLFFRIINGENELPQRLYADIVLIYLVLFYFIKQFSIFVLGMGVLIFLLHSFRYWMTYVSKKVRAEVRKGNGKVLLAISSFEKSDIGAELKDIFLWRKGKLSGFKKDLLDLVHRADPANLIRLGRSYPWLLQAYLGWKAKADEEEKIFSELGFSLDSEKPFKKNSD